MQMNNAIQQQIIEFYRRRLPSYIYTQRQIYDLICLERIERNNQQYLINTIIRGDKYNFLNIPFETGARPKYIQIIDVERDGNCGIYAFILGLARLRPDVFNDLMNVSRQEGKPLHQFLRERIIELQLDSGFDPFDFTVIERGPAYQNKFVKREELRNTIRQDIKNGMSERQLKNKYPNLLHSNTKKNKNFTTDNFLLNLGASYEFNLNLFSSRHVTAHEVYRIHNVCSSINFLKVGLHWQLMFITDEPLEIPNRRRGLNTGASFGRRLQEATVSSASPSTNLRREKKY